LSVTLTLTFWPRLWSPVSRIHYRDSTKSEVSQFRVNGRRAGQPDRLTDGLRNALCGWRAV